MKKLVGKSIGWLIALLLLNAIPVCAQGDAENYLTITGMVKDKQNKKALENVNVSLPGTNIGTVTNADGQFSLKVRDEDALTGLDISHIGYENIHLSLNKEKLSDLTIWMNPHASMLSEVIVYGNSPRSIVEEAIKKIPVNYCTDKSLMTGFYRETVQKKKRYISISEAVIDVYKTSYEDRDAGHDKVAIHKGRRLLSPRLSDTLAVKVVGGPNLSIYLDVVKNNNALLNPDELRYYDFWMEEPILIAGRMQYVIGFRPRVLLTYALFYGKLYIDREKLSFTRAEFNLDMENKSKAIEAILYKKPLGLRFKPQEVSFLVTYKEQDGKTYLNYIRNDIRFKCDWKRRLFSSNYIVLSEIVMTDRKEGSTVAVPKKTFGDKQMFYDKVDEYWNEDFWKMYNIIEPTESLEHAVDKLKKQSQ